MKAAQRRGVFAAALLAGAGVAAFAYVRSLVPATHPDHDHGILNLDAGGRLPVETRREPRNLVGRPGHVLIIHFFGSRAPDAADELRGIFGFQAKLAGDAGVEFVLIAQDPDWPTLDAWLAKNDLTPPVPASLVLDPRGETTVKLNCKRPLETMFFNPDGKLSSQARGPLDWEKDAAPQLERAKGGATLE